MIISPKKRQQSWHGVCCERLILRLNWKCRSRTERLGEDFGEEGTSGDKAHQSFFLFNPKWPSVFTTVRPQLFPMAKVEGGGNYLLYRLPLIVLLSFVMFRFLYYIIPCLHPSISIQGSHTICRELHNLGGKVDGLRCNSKENIAGRPEGPDCGQSLLEKKIMGLLRVDTNLMACNQPTDRCQDSSSWVHNAGKGGRKEMKRMTIAR